MMTSDTNFIEFILGIKDSNLLIECSYHTTFRNEVKMDSLHSTMNQHIKGKWITTKTQPT